MRKSQYTYVYYEDGISYWFNGISKAYFTLPEALGKKVESALDNIDILRDEIPSLLDNLYSQGFIVDENVDEIDIIRNSSSEAVNNKNYMLVIMPTLNCNFKCWYCIQEHIESSMNLDTIEKVKNHIKYMILDEKIHSLNLSWFGGEPFLYFKEVIIPISEYAKQLCQENDVAFMNTATSNGALISDDVISYLNNLNFTHFQITLDGIQKLHDKVKFQDGVVSAFATTLTNINGILSNTINCTISLRVNYTKDNLDECIVDEVNKFISKKNRGRIKVFFKKVWQEGNNSDNFEKCKLILDLFRKSGYIIDSLDNLITDFLPCYVCRKYYNAINYNGGVFKCTASDDLYKKPIGTISEEGLILWNENEINKFLLRSFENPNCLKCQYLPICMGNCPRNYNPEKFVCQQSLVDYTYEDVIINYIKHKNDEN